jgi:hypothetical protein
MWPGDRSSLVLSSGSESCSGTNQDLRLLHHFEISTYGTLGSSCALLAKDNIAVTLALEVRSILRPRSCRLTETSEYAYLMHAVLAVAATHLRRLEVHRPDRRIAEAHHGKCALSGFRKELEGPVIRDTSDSILLSAIFLNAMSFSFIEDDNLDPAES